MSASPDPIARFRRLFGRARSLERGDPTAAALATVDRTGRPSARIVLLKGVDSRGFVFYTNYRSHKARDLSANPRAALCFHWTSIGAQVRIEGTAERVTAGESDAYFATRPRGHQLAAWASEQSAVLSARPLLVARYRALEARFREHQVPRPPHWGGYRLLPRRIEFWKSVPNRLHDRVVYQRRVGGWRVLRLNP